ncbi:contact-dependent growth inhibition system immunity protein [Pseudocitrobacter sp. 73]|uniref:contact-dependent growth inhibition system immunity protein n=1 Tax=Pseudocitrobacter sp. 73 TaxID=2605731 RepID=UPI002107853F|nr:contact-dependent growth inhibition system immunity protein [Pseudocitrobacter sp. 73]
MNLEFDSSGANSGLVLWYNKLLTKTIDELTAIDIARMIRQNIAVEFAIGRAIQFIEEKEVLDELYEGELLESIQKAQERLK